MKMVKSLLLGSAAGIVAVAGAQAADLPIKAKAVEYVKVCSLYGVGFYYIPGTDICMKIGGYVRAEYGYGNIGASLTALDNTGADGQRTRTSGPDYNQRNRAIITMDTRQQTDYGTLRTYMNVGYSNDIPALATGSGVYSNRAFVQIAGFTFGLATSFYDLFSSPATSFSVPWSSDTGDSGWKVAAYTAQFGNGVSWTTSFEEPRRAGVDLSTSAATLGTQSTANNVKVRFPDIVENIRWDSAAGSVQVMGALHDASAGYYGTSQNTGHPSDKFGYAAGVGARINTPWVAPGNYFQGQFNYTVGASRYAAVTPFATGQPAIFAGGTSLGFGVVADSVYGATGDVQLTTAWSAQAAYENYWTPSLRTSFVMGYTSVSYNDTATALLCTQWATSACGAGSMNFQHLSLSSRTQWDITNGFYIGMEYYYAKLFTAAKGQTYTAAASGAQPAGVRTLEDQNVHVIRARVHRDITP